MSLVVLPFRLALQRTHFVTAGTHLCFPASWNLRLPAAGFREEVQDVVTPLLTACSGFLLAVLWMDLIFDAQVLAHRSAGVELPEPVLASIAGYYHRATTTSRPMSHLIAIVMVILLGTLGFRAVRGHDPGWLVAVSAALAGVPILLALIRTVPNAVRLGSRLGTPAEQTRLARSIWRDHLLCFGCMLAFLVLWAARSEVA
jgi:hypothetical protein